MAKNSKTLHRRMRSQKLGRGRKYTYRHRGGNNDVLQQKMADVKNVVQEITEQDGQIKMMEQELNKRKEELRMMKIKAESMAAELDKLLSAYD
jgi:hypothetical protein